MIDLEYQFFPVQGLDTTVEVTALTASMTNPTLEATSEPERFEITYGG